MSLPPGPAEPLAPADSAADAGAPPVGGMRRVTADFLAALRFFTRVPVPGWVGHSAGQMERTVAWLPAVGLLVGLAGGLVTALALRAFPSAVAVLLGMATTLLLTAAFHEDGLADAADGFGGGWEKGQVLAIMKDSRLGSYGAVALVLVLSLKWTALQGMRWEWIAAALVAGHAGSRLAAVALMQVLDYAREDDTARGHILARRLGAGELLWAVACGLAPLALLPAARALMALGLALGVTVLLAAYFRRRIGGYTGDCLGATQQLAEVAIYLGLLCDFS